MLSVLLLSMMLAGDPQEMMIPEGTVIPVVLNEKIGTKTVQENDPILFSLADDVRSGGKRGVVLIPRGSSVVGRVVRVDRAGHFFGRATVDIRMEKIVTPTGEVYDGLASKIVDMSSTKGRKGQIRADGGIEGPVHRKRDAFFLLFPPTTLFQLMAIPGRGPDVLLPPETRLYVKLMNPIYVERRLVGELAPPTMPMAAPVPAPAAVQAPMPVPAPMPVAAAAAIPVPAPVAQRPVIYLTWQDLDRLVSPVALYPDSILGATLAACAHPEQVATLGAYPDLQRRITQDPNWMSTLGQAYASQPAEVMNAVYRVRQQMRGLPGVRPTVVSVPVGVTRR